MRNAMGIGDRDQAREDCRIQGTSRQLPAGNSKGDRREQHP